MNVECHTASVPSSKAPKAKVAYCPPKLESYTIFAQKVILDQSNPGGTIEPLNPEEFV